MRYDTALCWRKTLASLLPMFLAVAVVSSTATVARAADLNVSQFQKDVFDLVNQERANNNLPAYKPNTVLFDMAQNYASLMAREKKALHNLDGKDSSQRAQALGYPNFSSECVAGGQPTAQAVVAAWMGSPPHRGAILHPRDAEIGVGHAESDMHYWVLNPGQTSPEAANPPRLVVAGATPPAPPAPPVLDVTPVLGSYERGVVENDWHKGRISRGQNDTLTWTNAAGKSWTLKPDGGGIAILRTGADNPYHPDIKDFSVIFKTGTAGKVVLGFQFGQDVFNRTGN